MTKLEETKKAFDRLAKSNDSYTGKELFESLYKCRQGCHRFSLVLLNNSHESCNESEKAELLEAEQAVTGAIQRIQFSGRQDTNVYF